MGLRYRKSINVGLGFRVNFSKSGVGYSWGVPGARFTKTATGRNRATLSLPGTGISWVNETSGKQSGKRKNETPHPKPTQPDTSGGVHVRSIENADIGAFEPAELKDFLDAVNRFLALDALTGFSMLIALCFTAYYIITGNHQLPLVVALLLSVITVTIKILFHATKRIDLQYEMDSYGETQVELVNKLAGLLQSSQKVWQINDIYKVTHSKTNAGAGENIARFPIQIQAKQPRFLKTNVKCYSVSLKNESLYILPDKLIIIKGTKAGAIDLKDLDISVSSVKFIEDTVPRDAEVVGKTWQYVNKDGSRDRRFNNNRELARCNYGQITFKSSQGFNTMLYVSNINKAKDFKDIIKKAHSL